MSVFAQNKKAHFNYEILERLEAGIVLSGAEVKSIRAGKVSFTNTFVTFIENKPILKNLHISAYNFAENTAYNPDADRLLLLKASEVKRLQNQIDSKSLTLVPLNLHSKKGLIKIEIALAKGKKLHDKRHSLKKKVQDRDTQRALKNFNR